MTVITDEPCRDAKHERQDRSVPGTPQPRRPADPLVSIIIPCCNAADFVGEAIESALQQTYRHREVIVIDDGSTDGSLDVIRAFGSRIRWETGPNRGGAAARNRGVELAGGEVIQFLDADDVLHPEKLERQVPLLLQCTAEIVYCDVQAIDMKSLEPVEHYHPHYPDSFRQACFDKIQTSAPLHWKKVFQDAGGFQTDLPCAQERDLHIRLACLDYSFQHVPETLATLRRRAGSVSSNLIRVLDQHKAIVVRAYGILLERRAASDERRRALAGVLARDARAYLRFGEHAKALDYFSTARQIHPDGGLDSAYSRPTRALRRCLGPRITEQVVQCRRRIGRGPLTFGHRRVLDHQTR